MDDIADTDLALFGLWPDGRGERVGERMGARTTDDEARGWTEARAGRAAARVVLELKSADAPAPADRFCTLLNDLTVEMREQFELFRKLRTSADALLGDAGGDGAGGDKATAKAARADAKAAGEAMSVIVRTLEKIDSLQRQLARDRADEDDRAAEGEDHEQLRQHMRDLIEARAEEKAKALVAVRLRDGPGSADDAMERAAAWQDDAPGHPPGPGSG